MKRVIAATLTAAALVLQLQAARIYVAPAAGGDESGDSWENAITDIQQAIDAAYVAGGGEIWLAQGIYYPANSLVLSNGVALYGGFPGLSGAETMASRDIEACRTVISGDVNRDDIWERFDPMAGESGTLYERGPIIDNGELIIPPFESARDTFSPKDTTLADNLWRVFDLAVPPLDESAILDGLWIVNGGRGTRETAVKSGAYQLHYGGAVYVGANSTPTVRNCRFVANHAYYGIVYYDGNRNTDFPVYENNTMMFNRAANRGGLKLRANNLLVTGSTFIGNYRTVGSGSGCIFLWAGTRAVITNCYFERNYSPHGAYSAAACIANEDHSYPLITDCTFTNNTTKSLYGKGAAAAIGCENINYTQIKNSLFIDNYSFAKAASGDLKVPGVITAYRVGTMIDGCTFIGNTVAGASAEANKTVAMAPVLVLAGDQYATDSFTYIINSTFHDNITTLSHNTDPALVYQSRAVLCHANRLSTHLAQVGIANSTFSGTTPGSDFVWAGVNTDHPSTVINSIFWSEAPDYLPLCTTIPGMIVARNVIAKNFEAAPADIIATALSADDPLLVPLAIYDGGHSPTHRVGAWVPGITNGCNLLRYANTALQEHFCYDLPDGTPTNLVPLVAQTIPVTRHLIGDANRQPRTADAFTLGAVQQLDAAAVDGYTLTLRARPLIGGTLAGGHTTQVVAPATAITPVTATPADGFSFLQWEEEDGTPVESSATLTLASLTENRLLYATFAAAAVDWSFDLGVGATFDDGGHTTTNLICYPGDPAPLIPPFTVDSDNYLFNGWSPAIPQLVDPESRNFTAQYTAKIFRIVRVVPENESGDDSGSSWANAKTDLQAAIDLAALWQGEVWLKEGIYPTTGNLTLRNHVVVRGGFAGIEGEVVTDRDPATRHSVISGDLNGNDCWSNSTGGSIIVDGVALKVWQADGSFAPPNPDGSDYFWQLGNSADNANRLFDHTQSELDQTAVLDGVVLSGAKGGEGGVMYNGLLAHPLLTNCLVIANNAGIYLKTWMVFRDCRFISNSGAIFLTGGEWARLAEFHDCYFEGNRTFNRGAAIGSNNPGVRISRCRFKRNYASAPNYGPASAVGMENGKLYLNDSEFIENFANGSVSTVFAGSGGLINNCLFSGNRALYNGGSGTLILTSGIRADSDTYIEGCTFTGNSATLTMSGGGRHCAASAVAYSGHRNRLVNCTIHDNSATATTDGDPAETVAGSVIACNPNTYGFLAHCSFSDNGAPDGDFVLLSPEAARSQNVFNTIFWHGDPAYTAISRIGDGKFAIYNSTVKGWESVPGWVTTATAISTADPRYARLKEVNNTLVRPLSGYSPVRRAGLDLLLDAADVHVFNSAASGETPAYRRCDDLSARTPTQPTRLFADAVGRERQAGRISQGAVQAEGGHTLLILR